MQLSCSRNLAWLYQIDTYKCSVEAPSHPTPASAEWRQL